MSEAPKKPKRPAAEVRAELLQSEQTKELAKTLGIGLEDYVDKVMVYYENPEKEPMIYLAPEAQLKAAGYDPPSEKDILDYLGKVDRGEVDLRPGHMKDGFAAAEKPKVSGIHPGPGSPDAGGAAQKGAGSALRDQVQKQVKKDQKP